jgi:hypothetical protein
MFSEWTADDVPPSSALTARTRTPDRPPRPPPTARPRTGAGREAVEYPRRSAERFAQPDAERLLDVYRAVCGRSDAYHPYWDISAAIGGLDESCDAEPSPGDERVLAEAVSKL